MAQRLAGKVAIVTGGASGIGEATARHFSREGARIVIADRLASEGARLAAELGDAHFIRTDVTVEADIAAAVAAAVATFGRLDCMINNAGVTGAKGPIADLSEAAWTATLAVLLNGVFFGIKHAAPVMIAQRSGCILSTASIAGLTGGLGPHAYTAAKHAVIGLTRSAASELASHGIRVNAIAPGAVPTPLSARSRGGSMSAAEQNAIDRSPLKRAITTDEISAGFVYLASDDARSITGQTLVIDGGLSAFQIPRPGLHAPSPDFFG